LLVKIQDFNKEVEDNIQINSVFSIEDITNEKRLDSFIIHDENIRIESLLQDSEFIMDNSDKLISKLGVIVNEENKKETENIQLEMTELTANDMEGVESSAMAVTDPAS